MSLRKMPVNGKTIYLLLFSAAVALSLPLGYLVNRLILIIEGTGPGSASITYTAAFTILIWTNLMLAAILAKSVVQNRKNLHVLSEKASLDNLTKIYNRSFFDPYLENQLQAANLLNQKLSILTIDIDHFKQINDTYGHLAGDHILVQFSGLVLKCIRKTDLLARYGGDEFIATLPATDTQTAIKIAERIRQTVSSAQILPLDGIDLPSISCSIGISTYPVHGSNKDELLKTSDITLYKAKQAGRNCTRAYTAENNPDPRQVLH